MLSDKDKKFLERWEKTRDNENTIVKKLLSGLPMAVIFNLPIILLIFVVYIFFPEWYTRISAISTGTFITVLIAVFLCTVFFSYFRMHHKWEMNDQLYKELKEKEKRADQ